MIIFDEITNDFHKETLEYMKKYNIDVLTCNDIHSNTECVARFYFQLSKEFFTVSEWYDNDLMDEYAYKI